MLDAKDPSELEGIIQKSISLRKEYEASQQRWLKEIPNDSFREDFLINSHQPVLEFFRITENNFIPLVRSGNLAEAEVLLETDLTKHYENHRKFIDAVVIRANDHSNKLQQYANEVLSEKAILLISVFVLVSLSIILIILIIFKNITASIKKVLETAKEISKGHVKARSNVSSDDEIGEMGRTFDEMAANLDEFANKLNLISNGNLNISVNVSDSKDELNPALKAIVSAINNLIAETNKLTKAAMEGKLQVRGNEALFDGSYREIVQGLNSTLESMVRPLSESQDVLLQLGNGDLTVRMNGEYKGDFLIIKNSVNTLAESFNRALTNVRMAVEATASASSQISASTEEMATGANEQTYQTTEIASAIEEMTTTIIENTKNVTEAALQAKKAGEAASEGGNVIKGTIDRMNRIADVVKNAAATVQDLGTNSEQIGSIVQVINDIADQTNLLALNAAIEAARAGEQGRGFAVVADEVRKLAERTTKATKEIGEMIRKIQKDTSDAVESMVVGKDEVEKGIEYARKSGESLTQIIQSSNMVVDVINQVASASEEQSSTSEQISTSIVGINNITQQSAIGVQEVARAAEDLNNLTINLQR
ncbi:MAG TPA: methyl-accepting chemotaxis protein, partial [Ignavibacteriaceae bacterium]|nr:methyl-accepting chemotaxis protein [Ignavibacteriaceae bacterium]